MKREIEHSLIDKIEMYMEYGMPFKEQEAWRKEAEFQTYLIKFLKDFFKENIWITKVSDRFITGTPDILCCLCGRFIAFELKNDKGVPSKLQVYNIDKIKKAGGEAWVIRTVEEALKIILTMLTT